MVKHYNTSIAEDAARILNSKQGQFLSDDVTGPVAVISLLRRLDWVKQGTRTSTGAGNVVVTPSDKDTYITGLMFSYSKNATCDIATGQVRLTAFIDGVNIVIASIPVITLTAENEAVSISFTNPIKLDRNTAIAFGSDSFTAGSLSRSVVLYGYTVETTK